MKKLKKVSFILSILIVLLAGTVMASSERYVVTKELLYESTRTVPLASGFVEVLIGKTNFIQYQNDENLVITPTPTEIREDEFGNVYAYFNLEGFRPGQKYKITVKRESEVSTYEATIPTRTNTVINEENQLFLEPAERIDSDDPELIAKAKEITEGQTTDYKKAQAIFEYINVNVSYDESSLYANKGSLSAFKNMRGVCEEFSTLFVAMCRAVDIPARVIEGYKVEDVVSGDEVTGKKLVNHVWAEIYLEDLNWVPVEPTVIYLVNGERKAYLDSFCQMNKTEYIAIGIYNYEKANRRMKNVKETSYKEYVELAEDILPEPQNQFQDIDGYDWAKDAIQSLYAKKIINGYSETEFGPSNQISRIEFIAMFSRLLKYYDTQSSKGGSVYYYPDYDESHWSKEEYDYLLRCYNVIVPSDSSSIGFDAITDVFGVGAIRMNQPITRGEAVAIMNLFLDDIEEEGTFTDVSWNTKYSTSILKAYSNGLINGYLDGSFRPGNPITRAEAATIFNRYITRNIYNF